MLYLDLYSVLVIHALFRSVLCFTVATTNPAGCQRCDHVRLSASSGYLASDTTVETGCGGVDCPWLIKASTGQVLLVI